MYGCALTKSRSCVCECARSVTNSDVGGIQSKFCSYLLPLAPLHVHFSHATHTLLIINTRAPLQHQTRALRSKPQRTAHLGLSLIEHRARSGSRVPGSELLGVLRRLNTSGAAHARHPHCRQCVVVKTRTALHCPKYCRGKYTKRRAALLLRWLLWRAAAALVVLVSVQ